jgi:polyvinyl alcohol dehydrogenase (cytochrome)
MFHITNKLRSYGLFSLALFMLQASSYLWAQQPPAEASSTGSGQWRFWGGNLHNTHYAESEHALTPQNVHKLKVKWIYQTTGNVSAIPTVKDNAVYFPDWGPIVDRSGPFPGSMLHAVERSSGEPLWQKKASHLRQEHHHNIVRTSMAVHGDLLIFGDQVSVVKEVLSPLGRRGKGATVYAVNRHSGDLVWKTTVEDHPLSQVTQSPVVYQNRVYVGVSAVENVVSPVDLNYPCCTFRGSMLALDATNGKIIWKTYMTPDNHGRSGGFSGTGVWGSSPAIDTRRGLVYIGTGQNYNVPSAWKKCLKEHWSDPIARRQCKEDFDADDNYFNAVVALDLETGAVKWAQKVAEYDAWTLTCDIPRVLLIPLLRSYCPDPPGSDFDFGQAPMLISFDDNGATRELIVVGQKSGIFWAFDPDQNGKKVWATQVGPGGREGGILWGAAFDGKRIYTSVTNFSHAEFMLTSGLHSGQTTNGGIWAALDPKNGALLWQTPDPVSTYPLTGVLSHPISGSGLGKGFFAWAMGPLTAANGIVFGGSMDLDGHMYAFDAQTGAILWSFASGGSIASAPAVVDGAVYWGSGYHRIGWSNNKFYAFELEE